MQVSFNFCNFACKILNDAVMEDFIRLYDAAPELSLKDMSLEEKYEALGIPSAHGWTIFKVREGLRDKILKCIQVESKDAPHVLYTDLLKCREYWFYKKQIQNTSKYDLYIKAITHIHDSFGSKLKYLVPFKEEESWLEALKYLKCMIEDDKTGGSNLKHLMARQIDRSKAIKRLMKDGLKVKFNDETMEMEVENTFLIYQKIGSIIEKIGGARCATLLIELFTTYNDSHHRLTQKRQGNRLGMVQQEMDLPIAYLINVAFNKLSSSGNERYEKQLPHLVQLATDVCAAQYDAQTYTIWEDIFFNKEKVDEYFRRLVIWDSLYTIPQSSQPFMQSLVEFLLPLVGEAGYAMSDDYTLEDYKTVMRYMMGLTKPKNFVRLRFEEVKSEIGLAEEKLRVIWQDIAARAVNAGYIIPLDYPHVTVTFNPAYLLPNGELLLYPSSLGATGWYEVMMTKIRARNPKIEGFVGKALEKYLRYQMALKGIETSAGDYEVRKEHGENDVSIQGKDVLILIEQKKKALTRMAKEGHVYQIILDFAGALLYPQEQAFHTEAMLVENGKLDLDDGENRYELELGDRRVEKFAVSLYEFGALHERAILEKVLEIFYLCEFSFKEEELVEFLKDEEKVKKIMTALETLTKEQKEMRTYVDRIAKRKEIKRLFFNSGFYSIEQICYILSRSANKEEFIKNLVDIKYMTFGTKDYWAEIDYRLKK